MTPWTYTKGHCMGVSSTSLQQIERGDPVAPCDQRKGKHPSGEPSKTSHMPKEAEHESVPFSEKWWMNAKKRVACWILSSAASSWHRRKWHLTLLDLRGYLLSATCRSVATEGMRQVRYRDERLGDRPIKATIKGNWKWGGLGVLGDRLGLDRLLFARS